MKRIIPTFIVLGGILFSHSCQTPKPNEVPEIKRASAEDFAEESKVSVQLAEGFELKLWAPGPLVSNAVALSFDENGVAYVAETARRKSSDLDIREHREWMTDDLALESIEDTRAFHLEKMATALSDQNTWQEDFNGDSLHDYRDLEVQTEFIRRIWDSDGDGRADAVNLYAADFKDMLTGVGAGVLYHDGDVFFTAAPDVYRLKDTDGDGDADETTVISHGYGIHIAYAGHDMSGLTIGPDGKIYWSIGDMGVNTVDQTGKRWKYPNQGAVMRCNPDGSDFEVFAHGLRNPQELAFDAYGNLISVDNDGDHAGEHERFVHIIEGSDTGWRINWQYGKYNQPNEGYKVWMDEGLHVPHFPGQAAYLLPPLALAPDGPAGLAFNPGTALNEDWNGYFFASYFTGSSARSKVQAFKLEPQGASFSVGKTVDVLGGIVPTGVNFGPDGALYVNDWLDGYAKKPQGRIWRLDVKNEIANKERAQTKQLLQEGMKDRKTDALKSLTAHSDMRVRMAAQFELVKRLEVDILKEVAEKSGTEFGRIHGIWGLGQLARKEAKFAAVIVPFLKDAAPEIRAQAAKVLGDARYQAATADLLSLLQDESTRVRFFATEALGKLGAEQAFEPFIDLLEKVGETDPHMRHCIVYALSKINKEDAIAGLSTHSSDEVRIGAVVALRHLSSPKVSLFLGDKNPLVVVEAARAIHDDFSIPAAMPDLAKAISRTDISNEAFLRRAINANLRLGNAASAERLAAFVNDTSVSEAMRADALWALGYWADPPLLDRVDNRYRGPSSQHKLAEAQQAMAPYFAPLLKTPSKDIRVAVLTAIGRMKYSQMDGELLRLLEDRGQVTEIRQAALGALAALKSANLKSALNVALDDQSVELRKEAQTLIGEVDLPEEEVVAMLGKVLQNASTPEKQKAINSLAVLKTNAGEVLLNTLMDQLIAGTLAPALSLDVLQVVDKSTSATLKQKREAYEAAKPAGDVIAAYRESLYGGNIRKGGRLFFMDNSAQCIRCHIVNEYGGEVGPDLSKIASVLKPEQLLEALVDPSARLAPGYGTITLKLKDGQELVGTVLSDNQKELSLKIGDEPPRKIAWANVAEHQYLPSAMISMKDVLSKSEIRDLMAFLVLLKGDGVDLQNLLQ
ncbi:MAG: HEAT repeat domain-containing protein [Saprospiraceae bacterium]